MAATRSTTSSSRPRIFSTISTHPENKRKPTASRSTKPKKTASTIGSLKESLTGAGVKKTRAPNTHHKRKTSVKDKVAGAVEKAVGSVERKPGKKAAGTRRMRGTDGRGNRTAK